MKTFFYSKFEIFPVEMRLSSNNNLFELQPIPKFHKTYIKAFLQAINQIFTMFYVIVPEVHIS